MYSFAQYNAISLFSGAMGLDLGVEKAGFKVRVCVEMDKYAVQTIHENTDIPVINKDINQVTTKEILETAKLNPEDVDLVIGGPPCQAFSTAGRQRGLADFRGNVIIQYLRVIKEIRPPYFILENVRGLLSAKLNTVPSEYYEYEATKSLNGSVLHFLVKEFNKLGYSVSHALFNAANYGVPETRERVIMFGHLGDKIPLPAPTHSKNGENGLQPWVKLKDVIGDLEDESPENYIPLRNKCAKYIHLIGEGENWRVLPKELLPDAMGGAYEMSGGKTGFYRRLSYDKPSPTLVTSPTMPATLLCHPTQLRPLSIREYARIQQFPDDWIFMGPIDKKYKQIGNAVPVGLGYMAGKQVMDYISGKLDTSKKEASSRVFSRYKGTTDIEFSNGFQLKLNLMQA